MEDTKVDYKTRQIWISGESIHLSKMEFRLFYLMYLLSGNGASYDKLLTGIWGEEHKGERKYLQDLVRLLRHKIEPDPYKPVYIINIREYGYKLVLPGSN